MTKPITIASIPAHRRSLGDGLTYPEFIEAIRKDYKHQALAETTEDYFLEPEKYKESESAKRKAIESSARPDCRPGLIFDPQQDFEGFKITDENADEIMRISDAIMEILRDPDLVFKYLKSLDESLGARMEANEIPLLKNDPQYYISGPGFLIPGPAPADYRVVKKHRLLSEELLDREQEAGLNKDGVAVFAGFVDKSSANDFVAAGHLFSEDEQVGKILFHGKFAHRLAFEIIRQAVKMGDLKLEVAGYGQLSERQLLQIMVSTQVHVRYSKTPLNLWSKTIDNVSDSLDPYLNRIEPYSTKFKHAHELDSDYKKIKEELEAKRREMQCSVDTTIFSACSPFVLTSLISCFGRDKVPNLCGYFLDNHYKQVAQIVKRVRDADVGNRLVEVSDEFIGTYCMMALSTGKEMVNGVSELAPFSITLLDSRNKTSPFPGQSEESGIRQKVKLGEGEKYEFSMAEYAEYKEKKNAMKQRFAGNEPAAEAASPASAAVQGASGMGLLARLFNRRK